MQTQLVLGTLELMASCMGSGHKQVYWIGAQSQVHDTGSPSVGVGTGGFPATDRNGMSAAARGDGLPWQ